jgi:hypothetical protein
VTQAEFARPSTQADRAFINIRPSKPPFPDVADAGREEIGEAPSAGSVRSARRELISAATVSIVWVGLVGTLTLLQDLRSVLDIEEYGRLEQGRTFVSQRWIESR